jgi:prepilin-type N-terminal cleavage/methylation domain-containing protein
MQRGFTLLEVMVALGAMTALAFFLLSATGGVLRWNAMLAVRERAAAAIGGLSDRLEAEEDSAWAIFTPPTDVLSQSNSDHHEVDFFTRDAQSRAYFWAYRYDAPAHALQRYLYASPGAQPLADGPPLTEITNFAAQTYSVTALQDSSTPVYSDLYKDATLRPATVRFGYAGRPWIAGGNQITYVRIETFQSARILNLSTQTAPSGFTVVLLYSPSPSPSPIVVATLSALIQTSQVFGFWQNCPGQIRGCSNADWPQYHWTQTTTSNSYQSTDGGYAWSLSNSSKQVDTGISSPTGGDLPSVSCPQDSSADYVYACSEGWKPSAPPGTAGMSF